MTEEIILREFREEDSEALENIIRETWNYDKLSSKKTAPKLAKIYLISCLANQTYTRVAVENGIPVGIIMGKNIKRHRCPLKLRIKQLGLVIALLMTKEGRKMASIFKNIEMCIDRELLRESNKDYKGEVSFFAVDSKFRGKGLGKKLFDSVVGYMRKEKIDEFYLYTDTTCNYKFYEHEGMRRLCERNHTFNIKGREAKMNFYLYEYKCK